MSLVGPNSLLLVEDNPGDADLIKEILSESPERRDVVHVSTLAEALSCLGSLRVDVVLLDLRLPDASGTDGVNALRALGEDLPIIVLTGLDDETLAFSCIAAGAQDYIPKGEMGTQSLRRAIGYAIARVRERAERERADELQHRLAAIVNASSDAIVSTTDGVITSWNHGAEQIFGYLSEEALGRVPSELLPTVESDSGLFEGTTGAREVATRRRDGRRVDLSVVVSDLGDLAGQGVGRAAICRDITERKQRDRELRRQNEALTARERQMRALAARLQAIREEERTRISREVHDELGQLLTGLKMELRWIARRLGSETSLADIDARLRETEQLVDRTIATVQRIAVELRPSALDALGLAAAIRDEIRRFEPRTGVFVEVEVRAEAQAPPEIATALFRISQELLTNVARHAAASTVSVLLDERDGAWLLHVEDDGVGMQIVESRPSLGLLGVRERAEALGGTVRIESSEGCGTAVTVRIPTPRE